MTLRKKKTRRISGEKLFVFLGGGLSSVSFRLFVGSFKRLMYMSQKKRKDSVCSLTYIGQSVLFIVFFNRGQRQKIIIRGVKFDTVINFIITNFFTFVHV